MKNIYKSLLEAQKKITYAVKDKANSHFKSKYATLESVLEAIKKPLNDNGIFILHSIDKEGLLITKLIHSESGESVQSEFQISTGLNPQQIGSAQTYAKRYNLTALLSLPTEDDDGNEASNVKQAPVPKQNYSKPPSKAADILNDNPFDSYVINLGDKNRMTGTKLTDHTREWIEKSIKSTTDWHKQNNKQFHANTKEFVDMATAYLNSLPSVDTSENIPF